MNRIFILLLLTFTLIQSSASAQHPFDYDLHLTSIPGSSSRVMICFHGYGGNYLIGKRVKEHSGIEDTLISFNFPDHDARVGAFDPELSRFGTIDELLPALYVLKTSIIDHGIEQIDLYGLSAGGGALVNTIAVLNSSTDLSSIGISHEDKKTILATIQKGWIILDAPLKSIDEIIAFRGSSLELEVIANHYRSNHLNPIESLRYFDNLALNIIIYFERPDNVISNRDDNLYIELVQKYNSKGTTKVIIGNHGGHSAPHHSLWEHYASIKP